MASQPRPLELDLLCQKLDTDFSTFINGIGDSQAAKRSNFLSKAIAAFVLHEEAGATIPEAVEASIDGGLDHGIDSVFIAADQTIWLVQSKYKDSGVGEPDLGDVSKFRDGVTDLLQGKWDRFNQALQNRKNLIVKALEDEACRVRVILAYTGGAISDDRKDIFSDLKLAFNGSNPDFLNCFAYGLSTLHEFHLDGINAQPIDANVELHGFGHTQDPYRVLYGRIQVKRLAELWSEYKDRLVQRNIRRFKGSTEVNKGLTQTLQQESDHFFYFNNGVTFLCNSIQEQFPRDPYRQLASFRVRGLSIINRAQTVGAIAREPAAHYEVHPAEVMATFICLDSAPEDFGDRVTQSRNRQNAVDLEDFAALDERQLMLQQTLLMAGIEYQIKCGEDDAPRSAQCFNVREAAPILACTITNNDWHEFVVAAKTDKKKLFGRRGLVSASDPLSEAYNRLFSDSLTSRQLWRAVQVGRFVQAKIRDRAAAEQDPTNLELCTLRAKEILKHSTWLLLHVIFIRLKLQFGDSLELTEQEVTTLSIEIDNSAQKVIEVVQSQHWNKQARSVFENRTDIKTIKSSLMAALAAQN